MAVSGVFRGRTAGRESGLCTGTVGGPEGEGFSPSKGFTFYLFIYFFYFQILVFKLRFKFNQSLNTNF
jgi:hypothetical protein